MYVGGAPALKISVLPVKRSMQEQSSVARLSSFDFTSKAELTTLSALSKPKPAVSNFESRPAPIAPSSAALPPLPMPSLIISTLRPLPSFTALMQSPQSLPSALCWAKPISRLKFGFSVKVIIEYSLKCVAVHFENICRKPLKSQFAGICF